MSLLLAPKLSGCLIVSVVTFKDLLISFLIRSKNMTVLADTSSSFFSQCFNILNFSFSRLLAISSALFNPALASHIAFAASSLEYFSLYLIESSRAMHAVVAISGHITFPQIGMVLFCKSGVPLTLNVMTSD